MRWQLRSAIFSVKYNVATDKLFLSDINDSRNYTERCSQLHIEFLHTEQLHLLMIMSK